MLSTIAVIGICFVISVCVLLTGSGFAVWFLRLRDRSTQATSLQRGLNTYHRTHLSFDGANYSHIQQPRASLRWSGHPPFGVVGERWVEVSSQESIRPQQMASIEEQPEIDDIFPTPKRSRSLRHTLYGNSLNLSKIHPQKKIEIARAQHSMPLSPLLAITEFTGPSEAATPDVVELPTSITPRQTPEKPDIGGSCGRSASIQWPLSLAVRRSKYIPATDVTSLSKQNSFLMRKSSIGTTVHAERPNTNRSVSMVSAISNAPGDPPPLLPPMTLQRYPQRGEDSSRRSNTSCDTIGSSLLGSVENSPSQTTYNLAAPTINLSSPGLHQFSKARLSGDPCAIETRTAAGKRAQQGIISGSGTHSFRASIRENATLRKVSNIKSIDRNDQRFNKPHLRGHSFTAIDASNSKLDLPSRSISHRSGFRLSLPVPAARGPSYNFSTSARHSTFKPQLSMSERASSPVEYTSAAQILTGSPRQLAAPRPASIASGDLYQWDLRPPPLLSASPLLKTKGNKCQNYVRISNLSANDRRNIQLPETMEEEEEKEGDKLSIPQNRTKIPGFTLLEIENGMPASRARPSPVEIKSSPSPFDNRPVLEPTPRTQPSYQRQISPESQDIQQPESDIFTNTVSKPISPISSDRRVSSPLNNWPLSSTPRNLFKLNSAPQPLTAIEEPYGPYTTMLPSPALTSATLFPQKSSVPRGPRNAPTSARTSRDGSPSPRKERAGHESTRDELRCSVMTLGCETSQGKLLDQTSRPYRNVAEQSVSNFSLPNAGQSNLGLASKSPATVSGNLNVSDRRRGSSMALNSATMGMSRSTRSMAFSPSMMRLSGISVWEDASVSDGTDLEMRNSTMHVSEQAILTGHDLEACENFAGHGREYIGRTPNSRKERERESKLSDPHGKGLDTPGSLYDRDGFLNEQ